MKEKAKHERAVVIGGSMAGLLAARALSDFYNEVIVVERDDLSTEGVYRKGIPQARHAHALLAGGREVIEELFPGITEQLISRGALPSDPLNDGRWFFEGDDLARSPSGSLGILLSRPLLEDGVRRRVKAIDGVSLLDNQSVRGLISSGNRIAGVVLDSGNIDADLVIDAAGRGSQAARWMKALGFDQPREERVNIQLTYTTRIFRREVHHMDGETFVVIPPTPDGKRGGVAAAKENGEWIVTLFGHFGNQAPEDLAGFIEYSRSIPSPRIHKVVSRAKALGDAKVLKYPASIRQRYEELERMPEGFLVFGDALCSFNPIYGQGMSSATLQARELQNALQAGDADLARRFYRAAAKVIDNPWSVAVGSDLRMPETEVKLTIATRVINWYVSQLHKLGHNDREAAWAFIRVAQLLDPPPAVMRPALAVRVLWSTFWRSLGFAEKKSLGSRIATTETSRQVHTSGF